MLRLFLLSALMLLRRICALPETDFPFGRIVGGEDASIEQHPYQVSIQTTAGYHFCGGSIINAYTIVTAAHCMQRYRPYEFQIRLGSTNRNNGGEVISVRAFKYHELYNGTAMINDVAVIKLTTPVRQTARIRFVALARATPPTGTNAVVTGWGTKCFLFCGSPDNLLKVNVSIVRANDCASATYKYGDSIRETMVCAYAEGKDACQGDSGGPLVANNELVGIVSWGQGCAFANYPGVYADVASLRQWILATAATL